MGEHAEAESEHEANRDGGDERRHMHRGGLGPKAWSHLA
jgi:hypothetical protein